MKIEKIKKTNSGKYKIIFDNNDKITTYDDVIINNGILYKPKIDSDLVNKINVETRYYDFYNKAITYISKRLRSEKEISSYLDKLNVISKDKEKIINNLKGIGLINDFNFVKAYISDKIYLSSSGPYKIKKELLEHNISEEVIDSEFEKIDQKIILDKLYRLINKKVISDKKHSVYIIKQKILNDFINFGYDKDMIINCLEKISFDSNIDKEFDKLYNKLATKYSGNELYNNIKQKLYQKGFDINEINHLINKKVEM